MRGETWENGERRKISVKGVMITRRTVGRVCGREKKGSRLGGRESGGRITYCCGPGIYRGGKRREV